MIVDQAQAVVKEPEVDRQEWYLEPRKYRSWGWVIAGWREEAIQGTLKGWTGTHHPEPLFVDP